MLLSFLEVYIVHGNGFFFFFKDHFALFLGERPK